MTIPTGINSKDLHLSDVITFNASLNVDDNDTTCDESIGVITSCTITDAISLGNSCKKGTLLVSISTS